MFYLIGQFAVCYAVAHLLTSSLCDIIDKKINEKKF